MFRFLLIAVVICVAFVLRVYGRVGGRLFGLAFTNLTSGSVVQTSVFEEIHVSSFRKTTLFKVIVPQLDFEQVYSLDCSNNWSKTIIFAQDIATPTQDLTYPLAAVVASQNFSINVQVSKALPGSIGGYLAMPLFNRAGNSYGYYIPSYSCDISTLSVVTVQNSTTMSIVKEVNGDGSNFVKLMNRTMQANDVMNWFSNGPDYTGLRVSSNKPLAVFGGCTCAQVPNGTASCDYVFEQIPEYNSLYGSSSATPRVILASVPGRPFGIGFNFRIIASTAAPYVTVSTIREFRYNLSESSTAPRETINLINAPLKVYCTHHVELTAGRANNTNNLYTVVIVDCSDDACEVMQYNPGNDILSVNDGSDPYMQFTSPLYRYTSDITFSTSKINKNGTLSSARNFLTVISAVSAVNTLQLDSVLIENSTNFSGWITLPATETNFNNFRVGWLPITDGFHTLTTADNQAGALYTAYVTGHGDPSYPTAYGYLAGYDNLDSGIYTVPNGPWYDMSLPPGTTTDECTTLPVTTTAVLRTTEASVRTTTPRSEVFGSITNAPQNTVSQVGHSVTFQCTTSISGRAVYWQFTNVNGVLQPPIYTGQMNPTYASRGFSVSTSSSSQASEYNLTIANVNLTDAGTYTCQDNNGIGEARAAWLTVLDDIPICGANDTITDIANLTRVGYLTCTVSMYGRISDSNRLVPVFNWTNCSMLQTGLSWTKVDDEFHRQYTSWVSVNVSDVDSVACDFTMSFVAVVSDSTINSHQPTYYSFIKSVQIARTTTVSVTPTATTTTVTVAPPLPVPTVAPNSKTRKKKRQQQLRRLSQREKHRKRSKGGAHR